MSLYATPAIERTIKIDDLTPEEIAALFCNLYGDDQARFFAEVGAIASKWPGAGWCQQSADISSHLNRMGRETVRTLASHLPAADLAWIAAAGEQ